jgi:peroxiredoxin Q/BCP
MSLKIGDKAPGFAVNDQEGNLIKLSDFSGKKIVLYFYPKDMTPGCTAESCNLRDNYRYLQKHGYEILGVSTDNEKSHRKFIEKEKLPFRLLADTNKTLHHAYGTWIEKSMYGRKYMGTARVTFIINTDGIIEDIIEKVDTKNHASQILKNELQNTAALVVEQKPRKPATKKSTIPKKVKKIAAKKAMVKKAAKNSSKEIKKVVKKKK